MLVTDKYRSCLPFSSSISSCSFVLAILLLLFSNENEEEEAVSDDGAVVSV